MKRLKLSRFNIIIPDYPKEGNSLLYNTRTQATILLTPEYKKTLENLPYLEFFRLSTQLQKDLKFMEEMGVVLWEDVDESRLIEHWFERMQFESNALDAVILTTFDCNFGCKYCFEDGVKKKFYLDHETADTVINYLCKKATENRFRAIRLTYYGGEPLMNVRMMEYISHSIGVWAKEERISFDFGMVTNGSLLIPEIVHRLKKLGLSWAQVTLDGDRERHNEKRPYIGGEGSFDKILQNLTDVADLLPVQLSINFDEKNIAYLENLFNLLQEKNLHKKIAEVILGPVGGRLSGEGPGAIEYVECPHLREGIMAEEVIRLRKELTKRGFKTRFAVGMNVCPCYINNSLMVIDPLGVIYKCPAMVGRPQFVVGEVKDNDFNWRHIEFMTMKTWKLCLECPYVPMCGGGCRFEAFLANKGDYTPLACHKEYYDRYLKELIKLDYEKEIKEKETGGEDAAAEPEPEKIDSSLVSPLNKTGQADKKIL